MPLVASKTRGGTARAQMAHADCAPVSNKRCAQQCSQPMRRQEIIAHFAGSRVSRLHSFRSLCNALKAVSISQAMRAWRSRNTGRPSVCDLGCGKGGDIGKWMPHRSKIFLGFDGSSQCIEQASERHSTLLSKGHGCMAAKFVCQDLCDVNTQLPLVDSDVDVVCSHFFVQYAMESLEVMMHVLSQCARVCKPDGIFLCLVPDGDRVLSLLSETDASVKFGHFELSRCANTTYHGCATPFGIPYNYTLAGKTCTEYLVPPLLLERLLVEHQFMPLETNQVLSYSAQQFFISAPDGETLSAGIMRGQTGSHTDWLSLGLFRVFLARRRGADRLPPLGPEHWEEEAENSSKDEQP